MIGLYNGVTASDAGKKTGNLISTSNKLTLVLNSSLQEEKETPIAIRTIEENHKTVGETLLQFEGANSDKWAFSLDGESFLGWGLPMTITEEIRNANKIIYVKAKAVEGEPAQSDISTLIKVSSTIGTV